MRSSWPGAMRDFGIENAYGKIVQRLLNNSGLGGLGTVALLTLAALTFVACSDEQASTLTSAAQQTSSDTLVLVATPATAPETSQSSRDIRGIDTTDTAVRGDTTTPVPDVTQPTADIHVIDTSEAIDVSVGETVEGELKGQNGSDVLRFQADAGQWYRIEASLGSLGNSRVFVYDPSGERVTSNDNSVTSGGSRIVWQARKSGGYYLQINSRHDLDTDTYTLVVNATDITDDHANDRTNATAIAIGESAEASVEYQGDADFFRFQADAGVIYDIGLVSGTLSRPVAVLYDSGGEFLQSTRWYADGAGFTWKALRPGRYYIETKSDYSSETGSHSLSLTLSDIVDDHGDTAADATAVTFGKTIEGAVDYVIDADCFRFQAQAGQFYLIEATLETTWLAELILSNADGDVLSRDSSFGPWTIWQAPKPGEYFVRVGSVDGGIIGDYFGMYPKGPPCEVSYEAAGQGGAYTLSVSQVDITDDHSSYRASATLIEPGRSVEGSLEYERDMDVFRFQGEADKLYKIYLVLKTLEKASLFLDFANGEGLTNTYGEAPSLRLDWHARDTGDYYIAVSDYIKGTGAYTLILTESDIIDKHANDTEDATALTLSEPVEGSIAYQDDKDYFRFHAEEGRYYLIEVELGTLEDSLTYMHDDEGWVKDQTDDFMDTLASRFTWKAPQTADYYVSVRSEVRAGTGTYTLTVAADDISDDHANDKENATPITVGEAVKGVVDYSDDTDYFSFPTEAGRFYEISVEQVILPSVRVALSDYDQRFKYGSSHEGSRMTRFYWEAPESREYFVSVGVTNRSDTGSYTLTVALSDITDDHGDDKRNATIVAVGEVVESTIDYPGDRDHFRFQAEAGRLYETDLVLVTLDEAMFSLRDPNASEIAFDHVYSSFSPTSRTTWKASSSGLHDASVSGFDGRTGTYTLTVYPSGTIDDHANNASQATDIEVRDEVVGAVDYKRDLDYFRFRAEAGLKYHINVTPITLWRAEIALSDSEGQILESDDANDDPPGIKTVWVGVPTKRVGDADPGPSSQIIWNVPSSGEYYIVVNSVASEDTGTYKLRLTIAEQ